MSLMKSVVSVTGKLPSGGTGSLFSSLFAKSEKAPASPVSGDPMSSNSSVCALRSASMTRQDSSFCRRRVAVAAVIVVFPVPPLPRNAIFIHPQKNYYVLRLMLISYSLGVFLYDMLR